MTSADTVTSVEAPPAVGTDTPRGDGSRTARGPSEAVSAAVDVLLADAALDRRVPFVTPGPALRVAAGLARRPVRTARRVASLGTELTQVATGRSQLRASRRDRRFADPAWESSWLFRRLMQSHLAVEETVDGLISEASLDWARERQARLAASNVLDALAPSNYAWSNPAVIKETVDQGGVNLARGARRFAEDFPHLPATVDTTKFSVGENLAVTKGSVVLRTEVFELIQYAPQTKEVREVPLLFAPPTINKFYVLDLAPERSMVEWLVRQGQQVFAISWRNPDADQGHFDFDTYAAAVLEARDAVAAITGQPAVHVNAACSGGMIAAGALGHLAAEDRLGEIASLTLMVVALDNERAGTAAAFAGRDVAAAAVAESARRGYLDGQALAGVFTWLRPNDLVWNYVVNNYLMGKAPPAFDVLYWNQDSVRLAAGAAPRLHQDRARERLRGARRARGARHAGRPRRRRPRQLCRRRPDRPHHPVGERLSQHAAARRLVAVRALDERPHPGPRESARPGQPLDLPRDRRPARRRRGMGAVGAEAARELVARLRRVARRALRRAEARPEATRRRRLQGACEGAGHLRPRGLRGVR